MPQPQRQISLDCGYVTPHILAYMYYQQILLPDVVPGIANLSYGIGARHKFPVARIRDVVALVAGCHR